MSGIITAWVPYGTTCHRRVGDMIEYTGPNAPNLLPEICKDLNLTIDESKGVHGTSTRASAFIMEWQADHTCLVGTLEDLITETQEIINCRNCAAPRTYNTPCSYCLTP